MFVSSNAFLASGYARIIMGFLRDWRASPKGAACSTPVHIVELGAGHGRLSFLVLRELLELWTLEQQGGGASPSAPPPFRFIITDVAASGPEFWAKHESLARFVAMGVLDFAVFDAERGGAMHLKVSGHVISPGSLAAPVVALANYVFDTLRADHFRCVDGALQQAHAALYSTDAGDAPEAVGGALRPASIQRLSVQWSYEPTTCVFFFACVGPSFLFPLSSHFFLYPPPPPLNST